MSLPFPLTGSGITMRKLCELQAGEKCCVVGTLFKSMQLQPSILREISEEVMAGWHCRRVFRGMTGTSMAQKHVSEKHSIEFSASQAPYLLSALSTGDREEQNAFRAALDLSPHSGNLDTSLLSLKALHWLLPP